MTALCISNYLGHHVATGGPSKVHQVLQKKLLQGVAKAQGLFDSPCPFKALLSNDSHIDRAPFYTSPYSRDLHLFSLDAPAHSGGPGHTGSTLPLLLPISREPGSGAK